MQSKMGCILYKFQTKKFDSAVGKIDKRQQEIRDEITEEENMMGKATAAKNALANTIRSQKTGATKTQKSRYIQLCKDEKRHAKRLEKLQSEYDVTQDINSNVKDSRFTVQQRMAIKDAIDGLPMAGSKSMQKRLISMADKEADVNEDLKETNETVFDVVDSRRDRGDDIDAEEEFDQLVTGVEAEAVEERRVNELSDILQASVIVPPTTKPIRGRSPGPGSTDAELIQSETKETRKERKRLVNVDDMS